MWQESLRIRERDDHDDRSEAYTLPMSGFEARRAPRRVVDSAVLLALAALASLVVHQLAYLVAYPSLTLRSAALGDHGHVSAQWAIITPLAVTAAVAMILRQVRNLGVSSPVRARWVSVVASVFFLGQESIEGLATGQSLADVATHPAVLFGVALAPLVSLTMVRVLRRVGEIVVASGSTRPFVPTLVDGAVVHPSRIRVPASVLECVAAPRGPPALLVCS